MGSGHGVGKCISRPDAVKEIDEAIKNHSVNFRTGVCSCGEKCGILHGQPDDEPHFVSLVYPIQQKYGIYK